MILTVSSSLVMAAISNTDGCMGSGGRAVRSSGGLGALESVVVVIVGDGMIGAPLLPGDWLGLSPGGRGSIGASLGMIRCGGGRGSGKGRPSRDSNGGGIKGGGALWIVGNCL